MLARLSAVLLTVWLLPGLTSPSLLTAQDSPLRNTVERYSSDLAALHRRYDAEYSAERRTRLATFFTEWQARLASMPFAETAPEGQVDLILLSNKIRYEQSLLTREERLWNEMQSLAPFAGRFLELLEARRRLERVDPQGAARVLDSVVRVITATQKALEAPDAKAPSKVVAYRTAETLTDLRRSMDHWYKFSAGYDPVFSWWVADPWRKTDKALQDYIKFLREKILGYKEGADDSTTSGGLTMIMIQVVPRAGENAYKLLRHKVIHEAINVQLLDEE